jgi:hypothetical protein
MSKPSFWPGFQSKTDDLDLKGVEHLQFGDGFNSKIPKDLNGQSVSVSGSPVCH